VNGFTWYGQQVQALVGSAAAWGAKVSQACGVVAHLLGRQYTGNFAALHEQEGNDDKSGKATH
jgi:hypothetical protein